MKTLIRLVLGLIGLFIGIPMIYNSVIHFRVLPLIFGFVFVYLGWNLLTGKIKF